MAEIQVGAEAPDFTTKDQNNQEVTLSSFRGDKNVLLVFYPFAFSGVCTGELCQVRDDLPSFQSDDVQILAMSIDHPFALKAWATQEGYEFPLLSDFWQHGAIAQQYGVFNDKAGFALRGTFLIDKQGVVQYAGVNGPGDARDQGEWKAAIAKVAA
ncbi:peroxiredoxin (alkyl hydroperoxide reductase subunit C) [Antricoccus suffuscus]|uniref:Alkyl hydroperoxide reductase E n=1 Tax=Antricoccus suffuscus TaxID=1629062 RepID=A0A2T0ZY67_9ACTN|nr:peroxiredoxin [Antricoccus suffuscus]PRZ41302.1 peroxiredoxin (alkyl hydroperoxide reductase subunit C) [Antricoccus suffuscus]